MPKVNDFVIILQKTNDIEKNAVGLVMNTNETDCEVFFIGKKVTLQIADRDLLVIDVKNTGKPYPQKICNVCHILKDNSDFDINQTDAKGNKTTRPSCKDCRIDIDGIALKKEDSKKLDTEKPSLLFVCPICEKTSIVDITANLVKDHNHNTGKGREWLCDSCNTGLGRFKDSISILRKAIDYLEKHENSK